MVEIGNISTIVPVDNDDPTLIVAVDVVVVVVVVVAAIVVDGGGGAAGDADEDGRLFLLDQANPVSHSI